MAQASFGEINFNTWGNNGFQSRPIDPSQNTYVITHGWNNTGGNAGNNFTPADWVAEKAQAIRELDPNANIVITDWESGARPGQNIFGVNFDYFGAAKNTKEAGEKLAEYLKAQGVDPNKTELIGHSLGGHLSGAAGAKYRELTGNLINLITGLDAAGPGFYGTMPTERLDPNDAKQVNAFHTSKLGYQDQIGTRDFYFNKNLLTQPGETPLAGSHGSSIKQDTFLRKGGSYTLADGTRLDSNRLRSPETGSIDVGTTNPNFTGSTTGTFEGGSNKFSLGIPEFVSFVQFDGAPFTTPTNMLFNLGKLTYKNGVNAEDSPRSIDTTLNINLSITQPENSPQTFNYAIKNQATNNTTGDAVLDADRLTFSGAGLSDRKSVV